jgi:hypothetical protein
MLSGFPLQIFTAGSAYQACICALQFVRLTRRARPITEPMTYDVLCQPGLEPPDLQGVGWDMKLLGESARRYLNWALLTFPLAGRRMGEIVPRLRCGHVKYEYLDLGRGWWALVEHTTQPIGKKRTDLEGYMCRASLVSWLGTGNAPTAFAATLFT